MDDSAALVERFLAHLRYRGRAAATIRRRSTTLTQLVAHLAPAGLLDVDVDDLEAFLGRWPCEATRRAYRNDVRDFYRWAMVKHHAVIDPAADLAPVSEATSEPQPLPGEILAGLLATPNPTTRRMIWIGLYAGLRVSEIARLEGRDVDVHGATLRIGTSKGGHGRTVRLVPELAAELADVPVGRLFPGATGESVSARIKRRLSRLGAPDAHPHHLRHSFATRAAHQLRGDVVAVAALLGHRSFATTRRYVSQWLPDAEQLRGLYDDAA
jgi:integrase